MNTKPKCFTDHQWKVYQIELNMSKNGKKLDVCFDCTIDYQVRMRKEGKCVAPMKRIDKIAEYN